MKNLKRFLAVFVAVAIMAMAMVPAFAASSSNASAATIVADLGVLKGDGNGVSDEYLKASTLRLNAARMTLRLMGVEEEAYAYTGTDNFKDVAGLTQNEQHMTAYLKAHPEYGWQGNPDNTFDPNSIATPQMIYKVMLTVLGYSIGADGDLTYGEVLGFAKALGMSKIAGLKSVTNNDFAEAIVEALKTTTKGGDVLAVELVNAGIVDAQTAADYNLVVIYAAIAADKTSVAVANGASADDVNKALAALKVTATLSDATTEDVTKDTKWDISAVKTAVAGTYKATATAHGVTTTVNVVVGEAALDFTLSTDNLTQVTVKFNKAVDATEAAKSGNYTVTGKTITDVAVSSDKTAVTLTFTTAIAQQGSIEVKVLKAVGLANDTTKKIDNVMDVTIPVTQTITLTGPNTFDVGFSEPVQADGSNASVLVNNGIYGVASKILSADGKTLSVTLNVSSLNDGTYSVKVSGYKDFANFSAMAKTFDLAYAKDTSAPTVKLVEATQTSVKVEFSKAVKFSDGTTITTANGAANYFYQTYTAWKPYTVTTTDNKTFVLSFDDGIGGTVDPILPIGNVTVNVLKEAVSGKKIVDMWGNAMAADAQLAATVSADTTAPTVTKVEATAEDTIEVTFSEDVNVVAGNFSIKDSAGKAITQTITLNSYASNKATLGLNSKLSGGTYTIEVKDVTDKSLAGNKIATVTLSFGVTDKTAPTVASAVYVDNGSGDDFVYVTYSEAMATSGAGSAIDVNNYRLNNTSLPANSKVEAFSTDGKKFKITIAGGTTFATANLQVGRVSDLAGNTIVAFSTPISTATAESVPAVTAVNVTGKNTIEITVNKTITSVTADDLAVSNSVSGGAYTLASISTKVNDDGTTTIYGTLKSEVSLASAAVNLGSAGYSLSVQTANVKSDTGMPMASGATGVSFTDKFKPTYSTITAGASGSHQFTVAFDESVQVASADLAETELVIVDKDGKTLVANIDYNVAVSGGALVVTLTNASYTGKLTVSTKSTVYYITDANSNTVNAFSGKEVTLN